MAWTARIVALGLLIALTSCSGSDSGSAEGSESARSDSGVECVLDSECPGGFCDRGSCVSACPADRVNCAGTCCPVGMLCTAQGCLAASACPTAPCAGACCGAGEVCTEGACKVACSRSLCGGACCAAEEACLGTGAAQTCCPSDRTCGDTCCGTDQACVTGQCVTPGAACDPSRVACATRPGDTGCPAGQTCDATLERCVEDRSDESCVFIPPVGEFDPVPLFTWGRRRARACSNAAEDCQKEEACVEGTCAVTWPHVTPAVDDFPEYVQSTSIPVVADLDDDCVPEVIFNSYRNSDFRTDGLLRAIRGDTGARVWTASAEGYRTDSTANPAVGDADGDGRPEIYVSGPGKQLLAFDYQGQPLWTSEEYTGAEDSGSVTIANLDGTGPAEIIFGSVVYDIDGRLVFEGTAGRGLGGQGPISCVADLDGDGRAELIAGRTAYAFTGLVADGSLAASVRFTAETADGYCGVADFNDDGGPEVVLVANGIVYVLQGQTGEVLASLAIPPGSDQGHGGAPNIADFDGDGRPEIATAGASRYVVMRYSEPGTLSVVWSAPTEDDSSSRTGSSVFDFDGDGRAEVVYNDEEFVRIYPGQEPDCLMSPPGPGCDATMNDGEILFRDLNSSRTRTEYPVIADVDGDFKAEIVFPTSNEADFLDPALTGDSGIEVWRDRLDNWVGTRAVWNQHSYHITNVGLDGAVPNVEDASWATPVGMPFNSYRRNAQGDRAVQCAPDLVVERIRQRTESCPNLVIVVDVVNQGCLGVGPGVVVDLVNSDGQRVGQGVTSAAIPAGRSESVTVAVSGLGSSFSLDVTMTVDADSALNECVETNNGSAQFEVECRPQL